MDLNQIDLAFKSDDIGFVKLAFRQYLLGQAYDKLLDAAAEFCSAEYIGITHDAILSRIAEAYHVYDFFLFPDVSIREFIQDAFEEYCGISEENLEKLWEEL